MLSRFLPVLLALMALLGVPALFLFKSVLNYFLPSGMRRRRMTVWTGAALLTVLTETLAVVFWRVLLIWFGYLLASAGLCEVAFRLGRRIVRALRNRGGQTGKGTRFASSVWRSRVLPFLIATAAVICGVVNLQNVRTTEYTVTSAKISAPMNIFVMSDFHYDTIQNVEETKRYLSYVSSEQPDLVLLAGDMTDEGTSRERMEELFLEIGKIPAKYGIFAVDGNHDHKNYASADEKTYGIREYREAMEKNGIVFLEDEVRELENFRIVGRKDASARTRLPGNGILDPSLKNDGKFTILLDHQPNSASGSDWEDADLVLCGHTHGGQVFPVGLILELAGYNAGRYDEKDRTVIVTSGVAGWGFLLKTQGRAEGVLIRLTPES
ncbi:MAG: metallophosphoesterase family protein [Clostridia bacterium]|nr:metallophosphoesterase family protein [Clostridia bacterium]